MQLYAAKIHKEVYIKTISPEKSGLIDD